MSNIRDVSKVAGVSVATVSRALQKPELVTEKTRAKVAAAVRELGYQPNMMARNFRRKKSFNILVLVPDFSNPFFSKVIRGIQTTARSYGYNILLGDTQNHEDIEEEMASLLLSNLADGIIQLSARFPFEDLNASGGRILPIVNCCECVETDSMPTVSLDNVGAARAVADHLISLDHTSIGIISGPPDSPLTKSRLSGFLSRLDESGVSVREDCCVDGDYSIESGALAMKELLRLLTRPTAVFCFNDEMAYGAMQQIKAVGLRIPDDIALVGFDDLPYSRIMEPSLTTVSQPSEGFGPAAVEQLLALINGYDLPSRHIQLSFELK
ncbi:MAG: LacI family DNA-binding transcriptional regulator, partial [Pseudomonadota bacterium]